MYKILLSIFLITFCSEQPFSTIPARHAPDDGLSVLKQQVVKDILATSFDPAQTMALAAKLRSDGSWADINYADKTRGNWPVNDHLARLNNMAVLYKRPGTKWTDDQALASKIVLGLHYWFKNDFICPNWWYPEIGVPKVLGPTMILMDEKLSAAEKEAGVKILSRARIGMTGQNKVWLSGNVIYRSLITGNVDSVRAAVKAIQDEVVVSESEGIQQDFSFHQHGPQQQFGNYGSSFAGDMLKWATIFQGTPFQFAPSKIDIMRNYLLQGMRWIVWKNKMDISACGRQLFPKAQTGKAASIKNIVDNMPVIDAAHKNLYASALNDFEGNIHFWRSDMTVHRRNNFYTSVKMSSNRVAGAESCNEENIQGYHLGDGAMYLYRSGEEYTDIFPFWDWKRIPGTTTFHDAAPLPVLPCSGYRIQSDFVGGLSDGLNGLATIAYQRDGLGAQKSYFFFDDEIICLGAGIHSDEDKEVTTSINQSFLKGNVLVKRTAGVEALQEGTHELSDVSWVLHDKWGYYFPGNTTVEVSNRQQTGDWHKVVTRMPSETIKANLFTLSFNHHTKPSAAGYAYYVFPAATAANMESRAAAIKLVSNTGKLQVVESAAKQMAGIVFVEAGETTTSTFNKVIADKPCVIMMTKKNATTTVSIADPTHLQTVMNIGLQGKKVIKGYDTKYDAAADITNIRVTMPLGPDAGKTVTLVAE